MNPIVEVLLILGLLKTTAVALGLILTVKAARAFRLRGDPSLGWMTTGMALLTLSPVVEGTVFNVLDWSLAWAQALATVPLVGALASFLYALRP